MSKTLTILEIGSGGRSAVVPEKGDQLVEVDPIFEAPVREWTDRRGVNRIRFNDSSLLRPDYQPEIVIARALNPEDIEDGILNEYEKQIKGAREVVVVIEDQTEEARRSGGSERVARTVVEQLRRMGRIELEVHSLGEVSLGEIFQDMRIDRDIRENSGNMVEGGGRGRVVRG